MKIAQYGTRDVSLTTDTMEQDVLKLSPILKRPFYRLGRRSVAACAVLLAVAGPVGMASSPPAMAATGHRLILTNLPTPYPLSAFVHMNGKALGCVRGFQRNQDLATQYMVLDGSKVTVTLDFFSFNCLPNDRPINSKTARVPIDLKGDFRFDYNSAR